MVVCITDCTEVFIQLNSLTARVYAYSNYKNRYYTALTMILKPMYSCYIAAQAFIIVGMIFTEGTVYLLDFNTTMHIQHYTTYILAMSLCNNHDELFQYLVPPMYVAMHLIYVHYCICTLCLQLQTTQCIHSLHKMPKTTRTCSRCTQMQYFSPTLEKWISGMSIHALL